MKPKRKRRVFVQKMLFGEDEMRYVEQSCRRTAYTDYWQGAADMMLAMLSQLPRERAALRNLNRQYMQAVCRCILTAKPSHVSAMARRSSSTSSATNTAK